MFKKIRTVIKQMTCNHEPIWMKEKESGGFHNISGEMRYLACPKCEKILDEQFFRYSDDGRGFM